LWAGRSAGDEMKENLELAKMACQIAGRAGAEQAQANVRASRNVRVELERGAIKSSDIGWNHHVSVTAYYGGGRGSASCNVLDKEAVRRTAEQAAELAQASDGDPDFVSLPEPAEYEEVEGLYDAAIAEMRAEETVELALQGVQEALNVAGDAVVGGGAGVGFGWHAIANSLGVQAFAQGTHIGLSIFCIVKQGEEVGSYFEFDEASRLSDFAPQGVGRKAAKEALRFLGAQKVETGIYTLVLGPLGADFLPWAIAQAAGGREIERKRSFLVGKKGAQIASEQVTLAEDPFVAGGLRSSPFDWEGTPRRARAIVDKGVLLTYLHDSYSANKMKEPNTGHAGGPSNLNLVPGDKTAAEIISEVEEGIYVNMGGLSPDTTSGEISGSVDFGFKIEAGKLAHPIKNTMVGVNFLDLLRGIDAVSSDYRQEPGQVMPTIRVRDVMVAGSKSPAVWRAGFRPESAALLSVPFRRPAGKWRPAPQRTKECTRAPEWSPMPQRDAQRPSEAATLQCSLQPHPGRRE